MAPADRVLQINGEHEYASRCGEDAYLWFYDRQCYGIRTLELPAGKQYRIECFDTWEMTRVLIADQASGTTVIRLPAKEGLAVLAVRTD